MSLCVCVRVLQVKGLSETIAWLTVCMYLLFGTNHSLRKNAMQDQLLVPLPSWITFGVVAMVMQMLIHGDFPMVSRPMK